MEIKQRRSNLELLRIVAMLMIIAFHIYWHCVSGQLTDPDSMERMGNGLFSVPLFYKKLLLLTVFSSFGRAANVVFMTLTGYFMVAKGREIRLIPIAKKLLLEQGYAAVLLLITSLLVFRRNPDSCTTLTEINLFNSMSWYVGYYFLVMLLARLFLNRYLEKLERKQYRLFLFALLCMTQFKWIIKLLNGVTGNLVILVTGVFLYSLGGYIRRYQPFARATSRPPWAAFRSRFSGTSPRSAAPTSWPHLVGDADGPDVVERVSRLAQGVEPHADVVPPQVGVLFGPAAVAGLDGHLLRGLGGLGDAGARFNVH